jgi:phage terminase large subunit-like protein
MRLVSLINHLKIVKEIDPVQLFYPYDHQMKLMKSKKKYLFMIGSNRLGKSDWLVVDNVLYAEGRHPSGVKTEKNAKLWIVVLKNDMVDKVLMPKFRQYLKPGRWEYNDNKKTIYVKRGPYNWSEIEIKSQEAGRGSFEGATVHRLSFDEQPLEEIFDSALVRVIDTKAQVLMAATMWEEGISWVYDRFIKPYMDGISTNVEFVTGRMDANLILDKSRIDEFYRQLSLRNPEEAEVRVLGAMISLSGKCPFNMAALNMMENEAKPVETCELMYGA